MMPISKQSSVPPICKPGSKTRRLLSVRHKLDSLPMRPYFWISYAIFLILAVLLCTSLFILSFPQSPLAKFVNVIWLLGGACVTVIALAFIIQMYLIRPVLATRNWSRQVASEDDIPAIPVGLPTPLQEISENIFNLNRTVRTLYEDMDELVCNETKHLAQKTRSLEILYELAATITAAPSIEVLIDRILPTLTEIIDTKAATVRLKMKDGSMRLLGARGFPEPLEDEDSAIMMEDCLLNQTLPARGILRHTNVTGTPDLQTENLFGSMPIDMVSVPLQYGDKTLGLFSLYIDGRTVKIPDDVRDLLISVGRHLGIAIVKANLDNEAKRLSIMQERNLLAHELHDSLAQTLASLRFQVSMLDKSLKNGEISALAEEVQAINGALEEANTELRELLAHFRAPMDERGLIPALEDLIDRFRKQTGIAAFLQKNWIHCYLPANMEMQILRIIQEALANIKKHSKAQTVRVVLQCNNDGEYRILVEDDGIGFDPTQCSSHPGRHIGLSIMRERAQHLHGTLQIESEPGEGTQLWLTFHRETRM